MVADLQKANKKEERINDEKISESDRLISIILILLIFAFIFFAWWQWKETVTIAVVGIVSFLIPMVLAYSYGYNLATLDNYAIRKSITISLTIVYIILLSISFVNSMSSGDNSSKVGIPGLDNNSPSGTAITEQKQIGSQVGSSNEQSAEGETQTGSSTDSSKTTSNDGKENVSPNALGNAPADEQENVSPNVPSNAPADEQENTQTDNIEKNAPTDNPIKNFLYIYAIIIGFYFGSRTAETYWNTNITKEILKNASGMQILEKRYAMGEINEIFVENMKKNMMSIQAERILLEAGENKNIMKEAAKELQEEINRLKALGKDTGKLEELMKKWRGE